MERRAYRPGRRRRDGPSAKSRRSFSTGRLPWWSPHDHFLGKESLMARVWLGISGFQVACGHRCASLDQRAREGRQMSPPPPRSPGFGPIQRRKW